MVFGLGILVTTVLTLVTPVAARTNVWLMVAVRIVEGIGEVRQTRQTASSLPWLFAFLEQSSENTEFVEQLVLQCSSQRSDEA